MNNLTRLIVEPTNRKSISARARQRRWVKFIASFPSIEDMRVLDLGGRPDYWESAPVRPEHVTVVNIEEHPSTEVITAIQGDACDPPGPLATSKFDLVVSNSLIEHVGGHAQRARLADVVHRSAPYHWVQTPYRYFPIEPHWLFPGLQFLPFAARVAITTKWKLGHRYTDDRKEAIESVHEVDLLSITQMADYFPSSAVWTEKFSGLIKSIVAIRPE